MQSPPSSFLRRLPHPVTPSSSDVWLLRITHSLSRSHHHPPPTTCLTSLRSRTQHNLEPTTHHSSSTLEYVPVLRPLALRLRGKEFLLPAFPSSPLPSSSTTYFLPSTLSCLVLSPCYPIFSPCPFSLHSYKYPVLSTHPAHFPTHGTTKTP